MMHVCSKEELEMTKQQEAEKASRAGAERYSTRPEVVLDPAKKELLSALEEMEALGLLKKDQVFVLGMSTSEILGERIGQQSDPEVGRILVEICAEFLTARGVTLALQCCEHLNRALIVPATLRREVYTRQVHVRPQPKAGGSAATAYWDWLEAKGKSPIAVEAIEADCGFDVGHTLIGMHLKAVAIPLRLQIKAIGKAPLVAAKTRLPYIGGPRSVYDAQPACPSEGCPLVGSPALTADAN